MPVLQTLCEYSNRIETDSLVARCAEELFSYCEAGLVDAAWPFAGQIRVMTTTHSKSRDLARVEYSLCYARPRHPLKRLQNGV